VIRSRLIVDLGAVRDNVRVLARTVGTPVWAVVKADGYGHGAVDVARAALDAGAGALCVATTAEGAELRAPFPGARIVVLGPVPDEEVSAARDARLELTVTHEHVPEGVPLHVKLDTGMGRWGLAELPAPGRDVVALMSHFASADTDTEFTETQIARFLAATAPYAHLERHLANSAGALRFPGSRLDAVRCGIAVYGISPFGGDPAAYGLRPALRWESEVVLVKRLAPGESTGYGRRFVASSETWIGLVPVGYADGFRRDMTGAAVLVGGERRRVVGTVSMDAIAVEVPRGTAPGTVVTLVGDGVRVEEHAAVAGTIAYEIVTGVRSRATRATREVVDD
jgi:alanine racemase